MPNTLYYGDNLPILREYIADESVDLIYLDPPFNSSRTYNVLFRDESGKESEAQIAAFEDTWHWNESAEQVYTELITGGSPEVASMIGALRQFIGTNQMMAYLVMMAARLVELHRVLKPTGSLYLHCDPTASHYLKVVLDTIFGIANFRTEIVWKRSAAHSDTKQGRRQHGRIHDTLLFYTKSADWTWNPIFTPYDDSYVDSAYRLVEPGTGRRFRMDNITAAKPGGDTEYEWWVKRPKQTDNWRADLDEEHLHPKAGWEYKSVHPYSNRYWAYSKQNMVKYEKEGRLYYAKTGMPNYKRYLDEMPGVVLQDLWTDINPIGSGTAERLGYPTQKPLELLKRVISASSNPGDVVLDPFCGCGTAIDAAHELGRQWIGIDITHLSIALMKYRLKDRHKLEVRTDYDVIGEPVSLNSAHQLALYDRYQFQFWALSLIQARPLGGDASGKRGKKGADRGIDGVITFTDDAGRKAKRVIVQVKSGKVNASHIRDLIGVVQREDAAIGVYITLEPPTGPMRTEATAAGFYTSPGWQQNYPKIQILTVEELLAGATVNMPPTSTTFRQAERAKQQPGATQAALDLD